MTNSALVRYLSNVHIPVTQVPRFKQATVPWHQDTAYLHEGSWTTLQPAAWLPLVDTDATNGCLRLVRKGHHSGRTAVHTNCWADTWCKELPLHASSAQLPLYGLSLWWYGRYIDLDPEVAEKTLDVDMRPVEEGGDVVHIYPDACRLTVRTQACMYVCVCVCR